MHCPFGNLETARLDIACRTTAQLQGGWNHQAPLAGASGFTDSDSAPPHVPSTQLTHATYVGSGSKLIKGAAAVLGGPVDGGICSWGGLGRAQRPRGKHSKAGQEHGGTGCIAFTHYSEVRRATGSLPLAKPAMTAHWGLMGPSALVPPDDPQTRPRPQINSNNCVLRGPQTPNIAGCAPSHSLKRETENWKLGLRVNLGLAVLQTRFGRVLRAATSGGLERRLEKRRGLQ